MEAIIWLGDFNCHHPYWDDPSDTRLFTRAALKDVETLISAIAEVGLDLALPPGIPTHLHNISKRWTRLDHFFILEDTMDAIITCDTLLDTPGINTDHLPILTTLDFMLTRAPPSSPKNFRNLDWEEFTKELADKLLTLGPPTRISSQGELDRTGSELTKTIQDVIGSKVPTTEVGIKTKKWWTKELKKLWQEASRKGWKASKYKDWLEHHSHTEHWEANKVFQKTLEHTKCQHWRDWLEKAEDPDIWMVHKYTASPAGDGGKCRIPVLKMTHNGQENVATTNNKKANMLARTFFPPQPVDDAPPQFVYPKPACTFDPIAKEQIKRQLARLKPYKAPGLDSIPNIVLSKCADTLVNRLLPIYRAMMENTIYYKPWKLSMTVVLHKPGKPQYDMPKSYRPITLLNTMCKVLTAIMAELMMIFYTEKHQLLPPKHFGGRPGRTTTDAVHLLVHKIKDLWCKRQVTAVLFLDIEGGIPECSEQQTPTQHEKKGPTRSTNRFCRCNAREPEHNLTI
jgi:hypothetical protein